MRSIGLDSAIAMSDQSKRTWWRRVSEKVVERTGTNRGRTMVALNDVLPFLSISLTDDDIDLILRADNADADAQNDAGVLFDEVGKYHAALYWWRESASQGHPDAMHHLGVSFVSGKGGSTNENIGIMWIAKAASLGHSVARQQMSSLLSLAYPAGR